MVPESLVPALVAESARKSGVCWVGWDGRPPRLVWHAWYDGALVVLSGEDQELPGIESATTAEVVMRSKDTGALLVSWTGSVHVVDPASESWDGHAAALLGVRLNLPDPATSLRDWRTGATVVRIDPADTGEQRGPGPLP